MLQVKAASQENHTRFYAEKVKCSVLNGYRMHLLITALTRKLPRKIIFFRKNILKRVPLLFTLLTFGCVSIPSSLELAPQNQYYTDVANSPSCLQSTVENKQNSGVNPAKLRLLNWNIHKSNFNGWAEDLYNLCQDCDIYTLQEGFLTDEFQNFFESRAYHWNIASAFSFNNTVSGVVTASKVAPELLCVFRQPEPIVRIPKTALVTRYRLPATQEKLMVVNIHSINFSLGYGAYKSQLETLADILTLHDGPLILAGDLNTWNDERQVIVDIFCKKFDLMKLEFPRGSVTAFFDNPLDHIYFRGITILDSQVINVVSSDHNPLLITFSISPSHLSHNQ